MLFLGYLFFYAVMLAALDLNAAWSFLSSAVTVASGLLLAMNWAEGLLKIWVALDPAAPSAFWRFYFKLTQSVEYVALSRQALGRKP